MAGITHLGVGLAAKRVAPNVHTGVLVTAAYAIDIVWGGFYLAGIERMPEPGGEAISYWSHGLFMAVVWSLLFAVLAGLVSRNRRTGIMVGLLVFSHWVVDFISHPMTAVFPGDTGLPLLFEGSPLIGLGVWGTQSGVNAGEYGSLLLGVVVYIWTLVWLKKSKTFPRKVQVAG